MPVRNTTDHSVFPLTPNDATKENMFFGQPVNVARYDVQHYQVFEKLIEKQLAFFWRPEEVDISKDGADYRNLDEAEKHIFISNLKYQTLLDSIQGRSPNLAMLPIVSIPELETWIETWSFSETVHSRSYTHILRNIVADPSEIFDDIVVNEEIKKRAGSVAKYYDRVITFNAEYHLRGNGIPTKAHYVAIYKMMVAIYLLEAIRFFVSFACSFAFAKRGSMVGNGNIIKLIARDENLHTNGVRAVFDVMLDGDEEIRYIDDVNDPTSILTGTWSDIIQPLIDNGWTTSALKEAADQEKGWAGYLFSKGSTLGLNEKILCKYIDYLVADRSITLRCATPDNMAVVENNPIPWINEFLSSDNVQVAPQETDISSYLTGQVDTTVNMDDFEDFDI